MYVGGEDVIDENGQWVSYSKFSYEEIKSKAYELYNLVKSKNINLQFRMKSYDSRQGTAVGPTHEFNIVGIFIPEGYADNQIIVNDNNYQKILNYEISNYDTVYLYETKYIDKGYIDIVYVSYDGSEEATNMFWNIRSNEEFDSYDSKTELTGSTISNLDNVDDIVNDFSQIFLWVGLVLAIFAALLFSNFISVSISNKRKEIGILRAIGARGSDVFKIFFSESIILSIICIILSSIGTIILSIVFNNALNFGVSVFVFGMLSLLTIIFIAILTALIATFIPVNNAARKKPIDSIRTV